MKFRKLEKFTWFLSARLRIYIRSHQSLAVCRSVPNKTVGTNRPVQTEQ